MTRRQRALILRSLDEALALPEVSARNFGIPRPPDLEPDQDVAESHKRVALAGSLVVTIVVAIALVGLALFVLVGCAGQPLDVRPPIARVS